MNKEELNKKIEDELKNDSQMERLIKYLPGIEEIIGYHFTKKALLVQAFTRSSYSVEHGFPSNEVLEFIGDKVIDFAVVKAIATKFGVMMPEDEKDEIQYYSIKTNQTESDFTEIKKKIVCNEYLSSLIDMVSFSDYLLLGRSDIDNRVNNETKVKADLLEAIIGAIAIDSKWDMPLLEEVCNRMLSINAFLDQYLLKDECEVSFDLENAINVLKELSEHGICSTPLYVFGENAVVGDDGTMVWYCACFIRSHHILVSAYAPNKKIAKKYSAYSALCQLFKVKNQYL